MVNMVGLPNLNVTCEELIIFMELQSNAFLVSYYLIKIVGIARLWNSCFL